MDFSEFLTVNVKTREDKTYKIEYNELSAKALQEQSEIKDLFGTFGGITFDKGVFRVHTMGSFYFWTKIVWEYFRDYKEKVLCFGFDWMGRQYGIHRSKSIIYMFDPATGKAFELEGDLQTFFNVDLVEYKEDTLVESDFKSLVNKLSKEELNISDCLGFKTLLFLGGEDIPENYEKIDMEVYWEINYQVFLKVKQLPGRSLIDNITFEE